MHGLETIIALNAAAVAAHKASSTPIPGLPVSAFSDASLPAAIWAKAQAAAQQAAEQYNSTLPPEKQRGLDCGFAWVTIRPARGLFVAWCKRHNLGQTVSHGGGGFQIWCSKVHNVPTQSIGVHSVACEAFATVLRNHGIQAHTGQRLD